MAGRRYVLGVFPDEHQAVSAIEALKDRPWKLEAVHTPFPSHPILEALKLRKSRVGYFTLAGGILGFLTGLGLSVYTGLQWNLVISGKPVVAWIPFVIVGFELTILFSVFGNIIGLLTRGGLPEFKSLQRYDPRCSGDRFGIAVACREEEEEDARTFLRDRGGEVTVFE